MADRPIFICGAPRSGTTLLMRIIGCSRNIAFSKYETWFFSNIYNRMVLLRNLQKDTRFEMLISSMSRISHGFYKQFIKSRATFAKLKASDQKAETLFDILQTEVASRQNRKRWGDKSPGNEYHAEVILKAYPSAKLVYIIRDFRDVSSSRKYKPSIKGQNVLVRDSIRGAMMWKKSVQQHFYNISVLPHKQYYTIKFEDIIRKPERAFEQLGDFIEDSITDCLYQSGEQWRFQPLNLNNPNLVPIAKSNTSYQDEEIGNILSKSAIGNYKTKLNRLELMLITLLCKYEAKLTGYIGDRSDLTGSMSLLKLFTGKSKHWEGQPYARLDPEAK